MGGGLLNGHTIYLGRGTSKPLHRLHSFIHRHHHIYFQKTGYWKRIHLCHHQRRWSTYNHCLISHFSFFSRILVYHHLGTSWHHGPCQWIHLSETSNRYAQCIKNNHSINPNRCNCCPIRSCIIKINANATPIHRSIIRYGLWKRHVDLLKFHGKTRTRSQT